jgi:hypothetical protein
MCYRVGWIHPTQDFEQCGICEHRLHQLKECVTLLHEHYGKVWIDLHKIRNGVHCKRTRLPMKQM